MHYNEAARCYGNVVLASQFVAVVMHYVTVAHHYGDVVFRTDLAFISVHSDFQGLLVQESSPYLSQS